MKIIPKKQQGGSFVSLFADYAPVAPYQSAKTAASSKSAKNSDPAEKGKLSEKDLFSLLKDVDGLPNDMQAIMNDIQTMYQNASLFGSDEFSTSQIANIYAQNVYAIKNANFNKKEYDKAYAEVEKNKGLNEIAIDEYGRLTVYDSDQKLKQITVNEYLKNQDKYQPLTNSNLLYMRAHSPKLVNDNTVLDVVSNGIGMETVTNLIKNMLTNLGSDEQSQQGYTYREGAQVLQGLVGLDGEQAQQLIQRGGLTLNGLYKTKVITKTQKNQAEQAIQYILQSLPTNAQALLSLKSQGKPAEMIFNLVMSKTSSTESVSSEYQDDLTLDGKTGKASKKSGNSVEDTELNTSAQFLQGRGQKERLTINPGTNYATVVDTSRMPLVKKDGTPLGANSTLQEISEGQFGPILDWQHATMGGQKINPSNLGHFLSSDGMIYSIDFPVDENGNPDLRPTTLQQKREADQKLENAGINMKDPDDRKAHFQEINQIYQECGLPQAYDNEGNLVGNWRRFGVLNGITHNKALNLSDIDDNQFLTEITNDFTIDNLIEVIKTKNELKKFNFDKNDSWIEFGYDSFVEGTIWIPLNVNYHNALAGSGEKIKGHLSTELERLQLIRDRNDQIIRQYNNPNQMNNGTENE